MASPKFHQLIDYDVRHEEGILFFRTTEYIDKNGFFDENDRINLYEYSLLKPAPAVLVFNQDLYLK